MLPIIKYRRAKSFWRSECLEATVRKDIADLLVAGMLPTPEDLGSLKFQKELATTILLNELRCPMYQ